MKTFTRFSIAGVFATLLVLTVASLLTFAHDSTVAFKATGVDTAVGTAQEPPAQDDPITAANASGFATLADIQRAAVAAGGKPPLLQGTVANNVVYTSAVPEPGSARAALQPLAVHSAATNAAGDINLWYGTFQQFGNIGTPQHEINILGSIVTPTTGISLTFALNGGTPQPLSLGPDDRRLAREGDFNVEIDNSQLITGANTILLATSGSAITPTSQLVTFNYTPGSVWPATYTADWSTAGTTIQNVAQVVDGLWGIDGATVSPIILDYDRSLAIGDVTWTDYEVTVPVTIHGIDESGFAFPSNGPGIGLMVKWQGHYDEAGEQPDTGWKNFGALGWYRWYREVKDGPVITGMQILGYRGDEIAINATESPEFGVEYLMKMSVQSVVGKPANYRFKTWRASDPEPVTWDMEAVGLKDEPASGSLLLIAHHTDATFGRVTVRPLSAIAPTITTSTDGNGTILVTPQKSSYTYGEEVEIVAAGNSGFRLNSWGGDLSGEQNSIRIKVTQNLVISASFTEAQPSTVNVIAQGNGSVRVSPQKELYDYDEQVTLTAIANPGFRFSGWSGSVSGQQNPITVNVRQNLNVTATFAASVAPPISDDFNRCTLNTALWTKFDPKGDSTFTVNGQQLLISVPANSDHNLFTGKNLAPRILQTTPNSDFIIEVKFESALTARFQTQGIVVEQDNDNRVRMEFYGDNDGVHAYAAVFEAGVAKTKANTLITVPGGQPMYMRVTRAGDAWTQEYSFDGTNWVTNITFTAPLAVIRSGVYGGNADPNPDAADTSPAHTTIVDYFFNTANRIDPEDGANLVPTINIVGDGTVTKSPDKSSYTCDEQIQLTATPGAESRFSSWSGDLNSLANPLTFTMTQADDLTATFALLSGGSNKTYLPIVVK